MRGEPTQLLRQFRRRRWAQVPDPDPDLCSDLGLDPDLDLSSDLDPSFYSHDFIQVGLS